MTQLSPVRPHDKRICMTAFLLGFATLIVQASPVYPQSGTPEDEVATETTIESEVSTTIYPNAPDGSIEIEVTITAEGLLPQVQGVRASCILLSSVFGEIVGAGSLLAVRSDLATEPWDDPEETMTIVRFEGESVEVTERVFFQSEAVEYPIESWTSGQCSIFLHNDTGPGHGPGPCYSPEPGNSEENPETPFFACYWPGSDPNNLVASFRRPGLPASIGADAEPVENDDPEETERASE